MKKWRVVVRNVYSVEAETEEEAKKIVMDAQQARERKEELNTFFNRLFPAPKPPAPPRKWKGLIEETINFIFGE